jgi:hypothetical protein
MTFRIAEHSCAREMKTSKWHRFMMQRFFPYRIPARWIRRTKKDYAQHPMEVRVEHFFDLSDRLRILWSGRVQTQLDVYTAIDRDGFLVSERIEMFTTVLAPKRQPAK